MAAAQAGDSVSLEEYYSSSSEDLLSVDTSWRRRSSLQSIKSSTSAGNKSQNSTPNNNNSASGSQNYWKPPSAETADYTDSDEEGIHEVEDTFQRKSASMAALKKAAAIAAAEAVKAMEDEQDEEQQQQLAITETISEGVEEEESVVISITNMETVVASFDNDEDFDDNKDEQDNHSPAAEVQQQLDKNAISTGDRELVEPNENVVKNISAPANDIGPGSGDDNDDGLPMEPSSAEEIVDDAVDPRNIPSASEASDNLLAEPSDTEEVVDDAVVEPTNIPPANETSDNKGENNTHDDNVAAIDDNSNFSIVQADHVKGIIDGGDDDESSQERFNAKSRSGETDDKNNDVGFAVVQSDGINVDHTEIPGHPIKTVKDEVVGGATLEQQSIETGDNGVASADEDENKNRTIDTQEIKDPATPITAEDDPPEESATVAPNVEPSTADAAVVDQPDEEKTGTAADEPDGKPPISGTSIVDGTEKSESSRAALGPGAEVEEDASPITVCVDQREETAITSNEESVKVGMATIGQVEESEYSTPVHEPEMKQAATDNAFSTQLKSFDENQMESSFIGDIIVVDQTEESDTSAPASEPEIESPTTDKDVVVDQREEAQASAAPEEVASPTHTEPEIMSDTAIVEQQEESKAARPVTPITTVAVEQEESASTPTNEPKMEAVTVIEAQAEESEAAEVQPEELASTPVNEPEMEPPTSITAANVDQSEKSEATEHKAPITAEVDRQEESKASEDQSEDSVDNPIDDEPEPEPATSIIAADQPKELEAAENQPEESDISPLDEPEMEPTNPITTDVDKSEEPEAAEPEIPVTTPEDQQEEPEAVEDQPEEPEPTTSSIADVDQPEGLEAAEEQLEESANSPLDENEIESKTAITPDGAPSEDAEPEIAVNAVVDQQGLAPESNNQIDEPGDEPETEATGPALGEAATTSTSSIETPTQDPSGMEYPNSSETHPPADSTKLNGLAPTAMETAEDTAPMGNPDEAESNSHIGEPALKVVGYVGVQTARNIAAEGHVDEALKNAAKKTNDAGADIFDRLYRNEKRPETVWKEPSKYDWPKSPPKVDSDEPVPAIFEQLYHNEKRAVPVWQEPKVFVPHSPEKIPTQSVSYKVVENDTNNTNNNAIEEETDLPSLSNQNPTSISKSHAPQSDTSTDDQNSKYETPFGKKTADSSINVSTAATAATAASTLASLTPPGSSESELKPSKLNTQFESKPSSAIPPPKNVGSLKPRKPVTSFSVPLVTTLSIPAENAHQEISEDKSPKNEFQMVKLNKKSPKAVERHIKESKLEFAELVANALTKKRGSMNDSNLEAFLHINNLKQEVAELEEEDDATQGAINKLRRELLDMFNQGSPMQEEYLLKWIMPLHRERDPKTGRLIMNADQVALLQSFKTSAEVGEVAGLGMVRSVLQSNFKAMNGAKCLNDIHEYAQFRLGKKSKRAPQNPWELLEGMFNAANEDDASTEDIHQRVCNALVQWVVREILGCTTDTITSRSCFHAIFLVASLKLELQRLAPAALEPASPTKTIQADEDQWETPNKVPHSPRNPYVEKLLQSNVLTEDKPSPSGPLRYRNPDTVTKHDEPTDTEAATANNLGLDQSTVSPSSVTASEDRNPEESPTIDKDQAMKEAMLVRDASARELKEANNASKESRIPESELPDAVRDSHRVIRCILGPNHPHINVSDCFEAIRLYSSLIVKWKEIQDQQEALLMNNPTAEEEKLRLLGGCITYQTMEPPLQIEVGETTAYDNQPTPRAHPRPSKAAKKKKHKKKKDPKKDSTGASQQSPLIQDNSPESLTRQPLNESSEAEEDVGHEEGPTTPAQLDIESLMRDQQREHPANAVPQKTVEEPPRTATPAAKDVPLASNKGAAHKSIANRTQKTIEATEVQAKNRNRLMDRLKRIRLFSSKKKS